MPGSASGRRALPLGGAAERVHSRATGRRRGVGDRLPWAIPTGVVWVAPADEEITCELVLLSGGPTCEVEERVGHGTLKLQHCAKMLASHARRVISTQQSALWLSTAES
jgi:hypothetical protein